MRTNEAKGFPMELIDDLLALAVSHTPRSLDAGLALLAASSAILIRDYGVDGAQVIQTQAIETVTAEWDGADGG